MLQLFEGIDILTYILMSEEEQKIQKYVIKSTPYGELTQVIKDLQKISPINFQSPAISSAIQDYNEQHLALFATQKKYFLTMPFNRTEDGKYIDQLTRKQYTVDHLKNEIILTEDAEIDLIDVIEELLKYLSVESEKYVAKYFKDPAGSQSFIEIDEQGSLNIYLGITGKNVNIANCLTGEWTSRWKITKTSISGTVTAKAHFFQSGNVQLHQKKELNKEFKFTEDMQENAKQIMKIVESFECQVQEALDTIYEELPNKFFKNLRRITPVTQTKMTWNINSVKMNKNLMGLNK